MKQVTLNMKVGGKAHTIPDLLDICVGMKQDAPWQCPECKKADMRLTEVKHRIIPAYLMMSIVRSDGVSMDKFSEQVLMDENDGYISFFGGKYKLRDGAYHLGEGSDKGHYIVDCLRPTVITNNNVDASYEWFHFDDGTVTNLKVHSLSQLSEDELEMRRNNCVMLMYCKK